MQISDSYDFAVPRSKVWQAIVDPKVLSQCIPACRHIEQLSAEQYKADVEIKFGFIKFAFDVDINLDKIDAPNSYQLTTFVHGGLADGASAEGQVRLLSEERDDLEITRLEFTGEMSAKSKLLALGEPLLLSTAKKWLHKFFARFEQQLLEID